MKSRDFQKGLSEEWNIEWNATKSQRQRRRKIALMDLVSWNVIFGWCEIIESDMKGDFDEVGWNLV